MSRPDCSIENGNISAKLSEMEGIGEYRDVGGHHSVAQSNFKGNSNYNGRNELSISESLMDDMNLNHRSITASQRKGYTEFANNGKRPMTLEDVRKIETQALIDGGASEEFASLLVNETIENLKSNGIKDIDITNIPWNGINK